MITLVNKMSVHKVIHFEMCNDHEITQLLTNFNVWNYTFVNVLRNYKFTKRYGLRMFVCGYSVCNHHWVIISRNNIKCAIWNDIINEWLLNYRELQDMSAQEWYESIYEPKKGLKFFAKKKVRIMRNKKIVWKTKPI